MGKDQHEEKDQYEAILDSFPNSEYAGIKRRYNTGYSGSPVFAVQYRPKNKYGLNGTFIVKIGSVDWAHTEEALYKSLLESALASLLAHCHMPSLPLNGQAAVAYGVAFDALLAPQPLMSILDERIVREEAVQKQVGSLAQALVNWYLDSGNLTKKNIVEGPYELVFRMLTTKRTEDLLKRVGETLPFWDPNALQITVEGLTQRLPNPLLYLQETSWQRIALNPNCPLGRIHGDLHTGNVICSPTLLDLPKIIDFDQSAENGVPFFDLAYLEFDIMRHLLSVEQESKRKYWLSLLDYSMVRIEGGLDPQPLPWDVRRAWQFIQPLRQEVQRLQVAGGEDYEMVWWLSTVAVGLNFARKGDLTRSRFERMAGLLYAAYGLARLLEMFRVKEPTIEHSSFVPWLQDQRQAALSSDLPSSLPQESAHSPFSVDTGQPVPIDTSPDRGNTGVFRHPQLDTPLEPVQVDSAEPLMASLQAATIPSNSENALLSSYDPSVEQIENASNGQTATTKKSEQPEGTENNAVETAKNIQDLLQGSLDRLSARELIYQDACDAFDDVLQQLDVFLRALKQKTDQDEYPIILPLDNVLSLQSILRSELHRFREFCPPLNPKNLSSSLYNKERVALCRKLEELLKHFLELRKNIQ